MVDPRDLGLVAQVRSPHSDAPTIYLYEAVPGGVGMADRLWRRHDDLVAGAAELIAACRCETGCPSCTGPRPAGAEAELDARRLALRVLGELGSPTACPPADISPGARQPSARPSSGRAAFGVGVAVP
jgi:DEAD/DEAH box helicase domain-containing protein